MKSLLLALISLAILAGCSGDSVVFAPTSLPPDTSPLTYTHPSGGFSVTLPRTWAVYTQNYNATISADFTPPGETTPALSITVARLDAPIETNDLINRYQSEIRADARRYTEQERQLMGDGSWRLTGISRTLGGQTQALNTFIQREGDVIAILEARLPRSNEQINTLQAAINTFQFNSSQITEAVRLEALSNRSSADIRVMNIHAWTTSLGIYFVTGEVANFSDAIVQDIPVRVALQHPDGSILADAVDDVMGYALRPGEFAPFSLRFGEGKPPEALRYTVNIGNTSWAPNISPERPLTTSDDLNWSDQWYLSEEGHFIVEGSVTNISDNTISEPKVIITLFDANQNVIAAAFNPLDVNTLQPGASVDYFLRIQEFGSQPTDYITTVQGWIND
jgi:hypothetical protein